MIKTKNRFAKYQTRMWDGDVENATGATNFRQIAVKSANSKSKKRKRDAEAENDCLSEKEFETFFLRLTLIACSGILVAGLISVYLDNWVAAIGCLGFILVHTFIVFNPDRQARKPSLTPVQIIFGLMIFHGLLFW